MEGPTAAMVRVKSVETPSYANLKCAGVDDLSGALTNLSLIEKPLPAERRVSMGKEKRQNEKEAKPTSDYENIGSRAPIGGEVVGRPKPGNQMPNNNYFQPGQKRPPASGYGGCSEQVYWNMSTFYEDTKVRKPLDQQRCEMAKRNNMPANFLLDSRRIPVESIDPSPDYANSDTWTQSQLDSCNYQNISPQLATKVDMSERKAPVSSPRLAHASARSDHAQLISGVPLVELDTQEIDAVLKSAAGNDNQHYVNTAFQQQRQMMQQTHTGHQPPTYSPSSRLHRNSESHSTASQQSFSASNSPMSQHGYPGAYSPQTYASYASPQYDYNSPHHQVAYSPASNLSPYQPSPSPESCSYMGSPASSQHVPSPFSSSTGVGSPEEPTLYPNDSGKTTDYKAYQQESIPSLTHILDELADTHNLGLENFQSLPSKTVVDINTYTTVTSTGVSCGNYPLSTPKSIVSAPHSDYELWAIHNLNGQHGGPVNPTNRTHMLGHSPVAPLNEHYQGPMGGPTSYGMNRAPITISTTLSNTVVGKHQRPMTSQPVVGQLVNQVKQPAPKATTTTATAAAPPPPGKMAIPSLPKPQPAQPAQSVILYVLPSTPQIKYPTLAPKPPSQEEVSKEKMKTTVTPAKSKGGSRGSGASTKSSTQAELAKAKAIIRAESDEKVLSKTDGETSLHKAIILKTQPMLLAILGAIETRPALRELIEKRNSKQQTPLFLAVITGQTWLTKALIKMGANCTTQCQYEVCEGQVEYLSPLHYASRHGDRCLKELKAMVESCNTDINDPDRSGMTALHMAVWHHGFHDSKTKKVIDSRAVVKLLLEAGALAHTQQYKCGNTALHYAVENGSFELTRLILESKSQSDTLINLTNYEQKTALHFAVSLRTISEENQIDLVKYLISKGANKNAKDNDRKTPRDLITHTRSQMLEIFDEPGLSSSGYSTAVVDGYLNSP